MSEVKHASFVGRMEPLRRFPISEAYWETAATAKAIADRFQLSRNKVSQNAGAAKLIGVPCATCGGDIIETCRSDAANRIAQIGLTYGRGTTRMRANICYACQRKEDDAKREAYFKRWHRQQDEQRQTTQEERERLCAMPYAEYLQTEHWQQKRLKALKRAEFACQVCYSNLNLHVHHRTYSRRGAEADSDLTVLCAECHDLFHERSQLAEKRGSPDFLPAKEPAQ